MTPQKPESVAPQLSLCWDGETPTAEVSVNGIVLTGHPKDVQRVYDELQRWQRETWRVELQLYEARKEAWALVRLLGGG